MPKFKRNLLPELLEELEQTQVVIIFGPRQVGKSYLLNQVAKKLKTRHCYFDLEQPDDLLKFEASQSEIQKFLLSHGATIFIDEFHYIKNAGKVFKALFDLGKRDSTKKVKIFASGSSAIEMHKHIQESMAGRLHSYRLMPMLLDEYLSADQHRLSTDEYLIYGGLPEVYEYSGEKRELYLRGILETYIQKDIKSLIKEENISSFNKLLFMLAEFQGQIVVLSNLARDLRVSAQTIQSYIDILEQTYTTYVLKSFSSNLSNELKKSKKYYIYDLGIRHALLKNFISLKKRQDQGTIYETYALHYLISIANRANTDVFFWRTSKGQEVDFIWQKNQILTAIEVKTKFEMQSLPKGLEAFFRAYPKTSKAIILFAESKIYDEYNEIEIKGRKVFVIDIKESHKYLKQILNSDQ